MAKGKEKIDADDSSNFGDDAVTLGDDLLLQKHTILETFSETDETVMDGNPRRVMYMDGHFGSEHPVSSSEVMEAQMSQLQYNNCRLALDRAISTSILFVEELQIQNANPGGVAYPVSQEFEDGVSDVRSLRALQRRTTAENLRSDSSGGESSSSEESKQESNRALTVIKLDLKTTGNQNVVSLLDAPAIAALLSEKLAGSIRHLQALQKRIEDTSSKVFVTGDLNSGKSSFCNALLRREVLPVDQQPCTSVFCEVADSRENGGLEEVHAVPIGAEYNIQDESTYEVHRLESLEDLVGEYDKYSMLKVYINDNRSVERSLVRNGVVDIKLIDAPGLNMDLYQTTEVFSRQEEIDLVVFVVSAENHFTLSAREFIAAAAKEKQLIFIVVNKFDSIRNKERCIKRIMDQVQALSPETHKDAKDFVHFVSSEEVGGSGSGGGGGGGDGDDGNGDDRLREHPDFDHLESSLRRFVLEKRALSKLSPAKNFLIKLLKDLESLASYNLALHEQKKAEIEQELLQLIPVCESQKERGEATLKKVSEMAEKTADDVYSFAKNRITRTVGELDTLISDLDFDIRKHSIYTYAERVQELMVKAIYESVDVCESYAKKKTLECIENIKKAGQEHDPEFFKDKLLREDAMFTQRVHFKARLVASDVTVLDFIDPSIEGFFETLGVAKTKQLKFFSWQGLLLLLFLGSSRMLVTKSMILGIAHFPIVGRIFVSKNFWKVVCAGTLLLGGYYLITDMPLAFKRKYAKKLRVQMAELEYASSNAMRVLKQCRFLVSYPVREIGSRIEAMLAETATRRQGLVKGLKESESNVGFFRVFGEKCADERKLVESFNLEIYSVD